MTSDTLAQTDSTAPMSLTGYSETMTDRLRRWVLGLAWAMRPPRTRDVPAVLYLLARHQAGLDKNNGGPPNSDQAWGSGIAGICANPDVETLLAGYRAGLYPFCHVGPLKWRSPQQRMVLFFENFKIEKNLRRLLRKKRFTVTLDEDFQGVVRGCAELRPGRTPLTWITPQIIKAFAALHEAGHAHSVEVWDGEGNLVGGAYGVSVGGVFFTESQFNRVRDAAKVGFAVLNCHLQHWGYALNDGKNHTSHLERVGMELIPRARFNEILKEACQCPGRCGRWSIDESLDVGNWDPKSPAISQPG